MANQEKQAETAIVTRQWKGTVVVHYEVENPGSRNHRKAAERMADHVLADPVWEIVIEDEFGVKSTWELCRVGEPTLNFVAG